MQRHRQHPWCKWTMSQAEKAVWLMTLLIWSSILITRQGAGTRHFPLPIGKTYYQLSCHQSLP